MKKTSIFYDIKVSMFMLKLTAKANKFFPLVFITTVLSKSISPIIWVLGPKFILEELTNEQRLPVLFGMLAIFLISILVFDGINKAYEHISDKIYEKVNFESYRLICQKAMEMDYPHLENAQTLNLKEKAIQGRGWGSGLSMSIVDFIAYSISIVMLVSIMFTLHWVLIILLVVVSVLLALVSNQLRILIYNFWDILSVFNRKFSYLNKLMFDFKFGKDIRLYNMKDMLLSKNEKYRKETNDYYLNQGKREFSKKAIINLISGVQMLLIYGFTTAMAFLGKVSISSFVMYIAAANAMTTCFTNITDSFITVKRCCQHSQPLYEFYNIKSEIHKGTMKVPKSDNWEIEFKNVSFTYPGTQTPVLEDVSIKIFSGEKLSIVGMNGAGKTTLVKLLLKFFVPDQGEILLNGININQFDYKDYLEKFSVVFQDFQTFAASVSENISASEEFDTAMLKDSIEKANLTEVVDKLIKKEKTQMFKIFDKEGLEFSGGQSGRLALARAIYKDSPFVILDEPTAALDPIAEYEIYYRFKELVKDRTTVFISHRLSSCKFCDIIAVFNGGKIIEYGTHDELLKSENGKYHQMWQAQSKYYTE